MLRDMYSRGVLPFERRNHNASLHKIVRRIDDEVKYFMDKLEPNDRERFQKLSDLYSELAIAEEGDIFAYGFSLATLLLTDVMEESKIVAIKPSKG